MYCVLFVCSRNVCCSTTAEGVFRQMVTEADLAARIGADSVALHRFHVGKPPDERAVHKWNTNPFVLEGGREGRGEEDGAAYLLPYWLGRYHGFITP